MILSLTLIGSSILVSSIEIRAKNKRKKINTSRQIVYMNLKDKRIKADQKREVINDSLAMGLGAAGLNLLDIYSQVDNHENVLKVIENRCPNEMGDASPLEWFKKIENLHKNDNIDRYVSLFKGQEGENIALELLREKGFNAELFGKLNHPDDDILVTLGDGTEVPYSVKCGSMEYIKECIAEHPNSGHYIINSDTYELMEQKGLISEYADQGIDIIDGGYSNEELINIGEGALYDIHDAGDFTDDIPIVALAIFGMKTINNNMRINLAII